MIGATLEPPGAAGGVRMTGEQLAAVGDRGRSSLLAAGAGSGKTAVMVERFAEAVLHDDVAVGSILTLTFTEKAAAELRERIRRRFGVLGEPEHARAVDAAWIGTIHGFCARLLSSQPLAAGLDPRFAVLDEAAARRLAAAGFETALESWTAACGAPAIDLAAAYGRELEPMIARAYTTLRSRGATHPRLRLPPEAPPPDPAPLAAAAARAAAALRAAPGNGARVTAALAALEACERLAAAGPPPLPGALDAARLPAGAKALEHDDCAAYRAAWEAHRAACADHHARPALVLLDELLDRFGAAYADAKAARAGVDFEDLELRVRDLLAGDEQLRARWAERFALIMVDEFQDTNRLQLDVLEALERGNLFAVGDESQSIYGFRHADVGIFRARRAALGAGGVRGLTVNFRSRPEILDVVNAAFGPLLGPGFTPLVAGRGPDELRLFAPDPPEEPRVELLACETSGWDEREAELGLAGLAAQPWRRAEARAVAARLRAEVDDSGRALRDLVLLVRATSSLRLYEQALEEQGLPTYVVGGRGYWAQEQVRDGIAYLALLANPHDEAALYAALSSPFCGAGTDALVLVAEAGRSEGEGAWQALRRAAADGGSWLDRPPARAGRPARRVRPLRRRRAAAGRAAARRGAARARDRRHRLRPRDPRARRRRPAAREPAQADAARPRVRARGGPRPARLPRLRRRPGPRRGARGRGRARVRGARRRAADDDPPRQGARVPGRLRRRPRAPGRDGPRAAADRPGRRRRPEARDARRRRSRPRARPRPDRGAAVRGRAGRGAQAALRRGHARRGAADPVGRRRHGQVAGAAPGRPADRVARTGAARRPGSRAGRGAGDRRRRLGAAGHRGQPAGGGRRAGRPRAQRRRGHGAARRAEGDPVAGPPAARPAPAVVLVAAGLRPLRATASTCRACSACRARPRRRPRPEELAAEPQPLEARIRGTLVHQLLERLDFGRPAPPGADEVVRARRVARARARAGAGRRRPRPGRGVRRLPAVRTAGRRRRRAARGRLRVRARRPAAAARS